jgi:hypothetical protein
MPATAVASAFACAPVAPLNSWPPYASARREAAKYPQDGFGLERLAGPLADELERLALIHWRGA